MIYKVLNETELTIADKQRKAVAYVERTEDHERDLALAHKMAAAEEMYTFIKAFYTSLKVFHKNKSTCKAMDDIELLLSRCKPPLNTSHTCRVGELRTEN